MKLIAALLATILLAPASSAQIASSTSSPSNASALASLVVAAFSQNPVNSVHLSGVAHATAGSTDETGTFTFDLQRSGEGKLQVDAGSLSRTESSGAFGDGQSCQAVDASGAVRALAEHNCFLALNWIVPTLSLQAHSVALKMSLKASREMPNTQALVLNRVPAKASPGAAAMLRHSGEMTITPDPTNFRPLSLGFNAHPDGDAGLDIPVLVQYSDYRAVNGATVPFHIEKYLNNVLVLDLQVESAVLQ